MANGYPVRYIAMMHDDMSYGVWDTEMDRYVETERFDDIERAGRLAKHFNIHGESGEQNTQSDQDLCMPFGKYKGEKVAELPFEYLEFAYHQLKQVRPELREAIEEAWRSRWEGSAVRSLFYD